MFKWIIKQIKQAKMELELEQREREKNYNLSKTKPLQELIQEEEKEMKRIANKEEHFSRVKEYQFFIRKEEIYSSIIPQIGIPLSWNKYVVSVSITHGCSENDNGYLLMEIKTQSKIEHMGELQSYIISNKKFKYSLEKELKEIKESGSTSFDKYIIYIEKKIENIEKEIELLRKRIIQCL